MTTDPFVYTEKVANLGMRQAHVAIVPTGVATRSELFDCLIAQLALPEYFGANWDALDECLRDLSWLERRRVVIFHEGLPALTDEALSIYIGILCDAAIDWRQDAERELVVGFPFGARETVRRLLDMAR